MSRHRNTEILAHPDYGRIPARRLLDCIFALAPDGTILHFHREQVSESRHAEVIDYLLNGQAANDDRARCCVIPPRVREFKASAAFSIKHEHGS